MAATLDTLINTIAGRCIAVRLRRLNRAITNLYDDALRSVGVKVSQLNILIVTAKLGLARPAAVCDALDLDASTLSRNVERMIAAGWLEAVAEEDARTQPFRLTRAGRRLVEKAYPAWKSAQQQAQALLGPMGCAWMAELGRAWGFPTAAEAT